MLYEAAVGYGLFEIQQFDEIGASVEKVQEAMRLVVRSSWQGREACYLVCVRFELQQSVLLALMCGGWVAALCAAHKRLSTTVCCCAATWPASARL